MRNAKKILAVLLAVVMLASMCIVVANAAGAAETQRRTISIRAEVNGQTVTTLNPGDAVKFYVEIDSVMNWYSFAYRINFPKDTLTMNFALTGTAAKQRLTTVDSAWWETVRTGEGVSLWYTWTGKKPQFTVNNDEVNYPSANWYSIYAGYQFGSNDYQCLNDTFLTDWELTPTDADKVVGVFHATVNSDVTPGTDVNVYFMEDKKTCCTYYNNGIDATTAGDIMSEFQCIVPDFKIAGASCTHESTHLVVDTAPTFTTAGTGHRVCDNSACGETTETNVVIPALINDTSATPEQIKEAAKNHMNSATEYRGASIRTATKDISAGVRTGFNMTSSSISAVEGINGHTVEYGVVASMGYDPTLSISADGMSIERTDTHVIIRPVYTTAAGAIHGTVDAGVHSYNAVITGLPQTAQYLTHTILLNTYVCVRDNTGKIISLTITSPSAASTTVGITKTGNIFYYQGYALCKDDSMQRTYGSTTYYGRSYKYVAAQLLEAGGLTADQQAYYQSVLEAN